MTARKDKPNAGNIVQLRAEPVRPTWMKGENRKKWESKVAAFRLRDISLAGFEDMFALYVCGLVQVEKLYRQGQTPQAATLTAVRRAAREFFDTPLSEDQGKHGPRGSPVPDGNPFSRIGARPD